MLVAKSTYYESDPALPQTELGMRYLFEDEIIEKTSTAYTAALKHAHATRAHPRCMCVHDGVPMYVARSARGKYFIKRMPNTGHQHHIECDSYEMPAGLSGRAEMKSAFTEDADTGAMRLALSFPLSKRRPRAPAVTPNTANTHTSSPSAAAPKQLSLLALLHCLYEDAGLNKWSPVMNGKRRWYIVQKYLRLALDNKWAGTRPLEDVVYIPEPFNLEHKAAIEAKRAGFFASFESHDQSQPQGIVIGEVKTLQASKYDFKLTLKHMAESPLYLDEALYETAVRQYPAEIALLDCDDTRDHVFAICTFILTAKGNPKLTQVALMAVTEHWLPFEDRLERDLVYALVYKQRRFAKSLRYSATKQTVLASCVLSDASDPETALFLLAKDAPANMRAKVQAVAATCTIQHRVIDQATHPHLIDLF